MPVAGLDLHKKVVQAAVLDDNGELIHSERFSATRDELERFARQRVGPGCRVALEATTNTWAIARILQPWVAEVVISNPLRTRAIAEAKIKTDRVDALVLAQLLRADYLPRVWQPDEDTRSKRAGSGETYTRNSLEKHLDFRQLKVWEKSYAKKRTAPSGQPIARLPPQLGCGQRPR